MLPVRRTTSEPQGASLLEWDPFAELGRQMQDLFDRVWRRPLMADGAFMPLADLEETDKSFIVEIELPGVKRDDIDVELAGRRLRVSGEREEKERVGVLRRRTRTTGRFHYEVAFPTDVTEDGVEASYTDGVLTVTVPKAEAETARRIQVK